MGSLLGGFGRDRSGSVALIFGLVALALTGLVGAAFDYSRAASIQTNLQRALDGAALLAAKNHDQLGASAMSDDAAADYVRKTFSTEKISDMRVRITFLSDRVRVDASANVPTTIANVLGLKSMPVSGTSEAVFGDTKVEIVMVLDNTGSMNDSNKLATLKAAAHNFVTRMQSSAAAPDAIRIGIVPFGNDVNLGSLKSSWWVDSAHSPQWTAYPGTAGCIWDREQPNDIADTAPSAGLPATLYSADGTRTEPCTLAPITPLTGDFPSLHTAIDKMNATGTTNLPIGLVWGHHVLSPSEPVTNALPFSTKNLTKYMIMMTDGQNNHTRWSNDPATIDSRTRLACDNIKATGIVVFTARIMDGNSGLLTDCATSPTMYYDVQDVSQLDPAFNRIYATIVGMRLAR